MRWLRTLGRNAQSWLVGGRQPLDRLDLGEFGYRSRRSLEALCRARAQPVVLGDDRALCRILGRYKLFLDPRDRGFSAHVLQDGYWEMGLTMLFTRRVRRGMTVIDVGANFGYHTLFLAGLVGEAGHVYAVEPAPATAALLRESVALNAFWMRITVAEAAAGATDGARLPLYVPRHEAKNARLVDPGGPADLAAGELHDVAVITLDSLVEERRVDLVKIDAEGAEEAVIGGAIGILRRDRPLLVLEFNAARSRDPRALLSTLSEIYGHPQLIDRDGNAAAIGTDQLLGEGEPWDRLLLFEAPPRATGPR